ncbi:MAG: helix-turn-helix domain-containing protein [Candidatus Obscuribacterales bacterium]|nr:helix-turn-helix domain-containing protein [Candidatus Obscuribacterales bacterium]
MTNQEQTSYSLEELSRESGLDTRVIRSFIENGLLRGPGKLGRYARYSRHHLNRLLAIKLMKETQGLRLSEVRQQLLFMSEAEINALAEARIPTPQVGGSAPKSALDYIRAHNQAFFNQTNYSTSRPSNVGLENHEDDEAEVPYADTAHEEDEQERSPLGLADSIRAKLSEMSISTSNQAPLVSPAAKALDDQSGERRTEQPTGWGPAPREGGGESHLVAPDKPIDRLVEGLRALVGERPVRRQSKSEQWYHIQITPDIELSVRGVPDEEQLTSLERVADYLREVLTGAGYE